MLLPSRLADRLAVIGFSVCVCLLVCPSVCVVAVLSSACCLYSRLMRAAPIRGRTRTLHMCMGFDTLLRISYPRLPKTSSRTFSKFVLGSVVLRADRHGGEQSRIK